jgi:hypothetical protein
LRSAAACRSCVCEDNRTGGCCGQDRRRAGPPETRIFRIITTVWGAGYLIEAALRVVIVYNASTGTALASSKVTPFLFAAILSAWTVAYGAHHKKKGERAAYRRVW